MFGIARLNTLARYEAPAGPAGSFGLYKVLDNPNAFGTVLNDNFGNSAAISNLYAIVGAATEDDAGGTSSGKAYIYSTTTGSLLYTLNNPNPFGTSASDNFGYAVAISNSYAIVGAYQEDDAGGTSSGKAYIYSTTTGSLLYTLNNPNPFGTSASDQFGVAVGISESYAIVGAYQEDEAAGLSSGKAYIYSTTTGSLLYTLDNPNAFDTVVSDQFSIAVAISESYAIVGASQEDDAGGTSSGKAYIYSTTTGSLLYTLNNPNPFSTSASDNFGLAVAISNSYAIVGARLEDDASGGSQGKAYIYSTTTGSLLYTLDNPNAYASSTNDQFGYAIDISESYAMVTTTNEDEVNSAGVVQASSGKAYIYSTTTGSLLYTLDNPNAFGFAGNDGFGSGAGITDSYAIVAATGEQDAGGGSSGKAYIYSINPADHISINGSGVVASDTGSVSLAATITISANTQVGDIAVLFDTSTNTTDVTPSGWTSINGATTTGIRTNISYKVLTSGDPGSTITGMAGTTRKTMVVFRAVGNTAPTVSLSTPSSQATTAAPTGQTITAGGSGTQSIYFAAYGWTTTLPTRGFTQTGFTAVSASQVSTSGIYVNYTIRNTGVNSITQANASITMTDGGTNTLQSFRMDIS
jgi:hypothetical protein